MLFTRRTLITTGLVLGILFLPFIAGALPPFLFWPFFIGSSALTVYALGFQSERAKKLALVPAFVALTITISDTALRFAPVVPDELVEKWPRMPLVERYVPNLNYEGDRFNDLSRMAGVKEWREEKHVRLVTDSAGFRNERVEQNRALDLVLLGDSFGAGGVSQEYTWTSILARDYGLHTYNLSIPAAGPWHEYINLWAEKDRLKVGEGSVLVWQLFSGNDLDNSYGSLDVNQLPWRGSVGMWIERINKVRARSPLRYLLQKQNRSTDVVARNFLNGRKLLFYKPYIEASFRTPEEISKHPHYALLRSTILAVKRLAESKGLRLAVVLVPAKEEVYSWVWRGAAPWTTETGPSGFAAIVSDVCAEEDILFLDLKPYLVRESRRLYEEEGQLFYWYDDTHLNTAGNTFTAPIIYRELVQRASPRLKEEWRARPK